MRALAFQFAWALLAGAAGSDAVCAKEGGRFRGFSFDVKWSTVTTFRRDGVTRTTRTENRGLQIYIGLNGHVFEYGGFRDFWGQSVAGLGKARPTRGDEMVATTIINNQLTRIVKLTRGFMIQTIDVSSALDNCTFSEIYKPDAEGKVVGFDPYTRTPFELVSRTFESNTCSVREGNIFSTDH